MLRWPMPLKLAGVLCVVIIAGTLFIGARAVVAATLRLGLKGILIRLLALYVLAVFIVGLLVPSGAQGLRHWMTTATDVARWPFGAVSTGVQALVAAPDAIRFAATGERDPIPVPGVEWVGGVPPTPIVANAVGTVEQDVPESLAATQIPAAPQPAASERALQVGDHVRVFGTEGSPLRARETASLQAKPVVRFVADSVLEIVDGPQTVDGYTWWKVRGAPGEGWCVADFLVAVRPDQ
jgi:hypothetical protein